MSRHAFFQKLRRALAFPFIGLTPMAVVQAPIDVWRLPLLDRAPDELRELYQAATPTEAELLGQLLIQNGFHPEFVPSSATGMFGTTGNSQLYIPAREHAEAAAFLREYLAAPPEATA